MLRCAARAEPQEDSKRRPANSLLRGSPEPNSCDGALHVQAGRQYVCFCYDSMRCRQEKGGKRRRRKWSGSDRTRERIRPVQTHAYLYNLIGPPFFCPTGSDSGGRKLRERERERGRECMEIRVLRWDLSRARRSGSGLVRGRHKTHSRPLPRTAPLAHCATMTASPSVRCC